MRYPSAVRLALSRAHGVSLALAALAAWAAPAWGQTQWEKTGAAAASKDGIGLHVSAPTPQDVFVGVLDFNPNSQLPLPKGKVMASHDGGKVFTEVSPGGGSPIGGFSPPAGLQFLDANVGYAAAGAKLYATSDGGANWQEFEAGIGPLSALAFVAPGKGVVFGDNGAAVFDGSSFTPATGLEETGCQRARFASLTTVWAYCNHIVEITDPDTQMVSEESHGASIVRSDDGGATWTLVKSVGEGGLGAMFFLDADHGWFTVSVAKVPGVKVLRTLDGANFTEHAMPSQGASMLAQLMTVSGIFVAPNGQGYAVGLIDTGLSTSEQGQTYLLADLRTTDGGQNWTLAHSPIDGFKAANEGAVVNADLRGFGHGFAVTTGGARVYADRSACPAADCNAPPPADVPTGGLAGIDEDGDGPGEPTSEGGEDTNGGGGGTKDGVSDDDDDGDGTDSLDGGEGEAAATSAASDDGCNCRAGTRSAAGVPLWALGALALAVVGRRRRIA